MLVVTESHGGERLHVSRERRLGEGTLYHWLVR